MVDQSYLITVGEFGAAVTLTPDLMRQFRFIYLREAALFEKLRPVGQAKYGGDTKALSLLEAGGY